MLKGKKDSRQRSKGTGKHQLGIFDIPDIDSLGMNSMADEDDDEDLEAELLSLISPMPGNSKAAKSKPKMAKIDNLDAMVAASLRDIPSDEDLSGGEDDPELLAELNEFAGPPDLPAPMQPTPYVPPQPVVQTNPADMEKLLLERLSMYKEAEANARMAGDLAKSRRLGRGQKTLEDLLKKAQRGVAIDENDIPLPVASGAKKPDPSPEGSGSSAVTPSSPPAGPEVPLRRAPPVPSEPSPAPTPVAEPLPSPVVAEPSKEEDSEKNNIISVLSSRRDEYKKAALLAKRLGDTQTAVAHVKVVKQFEMVIAGVEAGQPFDLSNIPPPPSSSTSASIPDSAKVEAHSQKHEQPETELAQEASEEAAAAPEEPMTILEALEKRMAKFQEQEETGKRDGNASKARRMGRIVKQYQDAIKLHKAGKPFPVDELPTPPGFPPILIESAPKPAEIPAPAPPPKPTVPEASLSPTLPPIAQPSSSRALPPQPPPRLPQPSTSTGTKGVVTRQEKQLNLLVARQKLFKEAALRAKQQGNLALAKEYLRSSKQLETLIEASKNGLPIEMSSIPMPPSHSEKLESDFELIAVSDCIPGGSSESEVYDRLLSDLTSQFKMSMETRNHFKNMGDVGNANKFEHLALSTKKDMDIVKTYYAKKDPVPKFHYEKKTFSIVRCNVDLNDNDLELNIIQGVNYNVPNPKEIDTYVRYELACPNDDIKRDKTSTIYNTNNPAYNAVFLIPIQRNNRSFQRIFKRHSIKCEVWSRGGFLRSDSIIGTVQVKLQPLETKCTVHDSFDLMDGRRTVGGKLEVKIRVRNPIQTKQIELVEEKWLIIG